MSGGSHECQKRLRIYTLELELQAAMMCPKIKLKSSVRVVHAFNCWEHLSRLWRIFSHFLIWGNWGPDRLADMLGFIQVHKKACYNTGRARQAGKGQTNVTPDVTHPRKNVNPIMLLCFLIIAYFWTVSSRWAWGRSSGRTWKEAPTLWTKAPRCPYHQHKEELGLWWACLFYLRDCPQCCGVGGDDRTDSPYLLMILSLLNWYLSLFRTMSRTFYKIYIEFGVMKDA